MKQEINIQNIFLDTILRSKDKRVSVLTTTSEVKGELIAFDNYTIVLKVYPNKQKLIYKNNIISIYPLGNVNPIRQKKFKE